MEALTYLTYLGILILIGLIVTYFAQKLKIPNIILLILSGILINYANIEYSSITNSTPIEFPINFIASISILALVMIVFDSTSKFKYKELNDSSISALKYSIIFLIANLVLFSIATYYFMGQPNIFLAITFAALMSGTSPDAVLYMLKDTTHKVIQFLKVESIINTPLVVLFPFIVLNIMEKFEKTSAFTNIISQIIPFLQQVASGIGAGLLIGLIILKLMRVMYSETLSPLIIISSALLSYVLAENIGGNGVLAVTTLGLMFGNIYVKEKGCLRQFSTTFSNFLEITVFILIGLMINLPKDGLFYLKSLGLFVIYILIRYMTLELTFRNKQFKLREKIFMSLNATKGIAVAVVAAILISYKLEIGTKGIGFVQLIGGTEILNYVLIFILYSIIFSTIAIKLSRFFIKKDIVMEDDIKLIKENKHHTQKDKKINLRTKSRKD